MSEEYDKARKLGERAVRKAESEGKDSHLSVLETLHPEVDGLTTVHIGITEIPLDLVAGTLTSGRAVSFAPNYMPVLNKGTEFAGKWQRLYDSQIEEGIRDPIKVYEYRMHFYVQEGNKRVSVMKYLDMPSIFADVYRYMPELGNSEEDQVYQDFLKFYKVCPIYDIQFTRPGMYQRFADLLKKDLKTRWDRDFINTVRGSYFRFKRVFKRKGGDRLPLTAGDAFFLYLEIFRFDSLLDRDRLDIDHNLDQIWKEVELESRDNEVDLIKNPIRETKRGFFGFSSVYNENRPLKILFVHDRDPQSHVWENDHETGRIYLNNRFGKKVITASVIASDDQDKIPEIVQSNDVVFTTRRTLMTDALRAAVKYPQVRFFNCSIYLSHSAVTGYFGRMYEAMFLLGTLAAGYAKNHKIGYVSNTPVYGRLSEINAFAIGAQMRDPEAKIYLEWTGKKDCDWKRRFSDAGIDVYQGPDLHEDDREPVHDLQVIEDGYSVPVARPVWNWNLYYEKIVKMILDGTWDLNRRQNNGAAMNCWWGMDEDVIDVLLSSSVKWEDRKVVRMFKRILIKNGWNPFEGELHGQNGLVQEEGTNRLSSDAIISMDWLNCNVVGSVPTLDELVPDMKKMTYMSGVKGTEDL